MLAYKRGREGGMEWNLFPMPGVLMAPSIPWTPSAHLGSGSIYHRGPRGARYWKDCLLPRLQHLVLRTVVAMVITEASFRSWRTTLVPEGGNNIQPHWGKPLSHSLLALADKYLGIAPRVLGVASNQGATEGEIHPLLQMAVPGQPPRRAPQLFL